MQPYFRIIVKPITAVSIFAFFLAFNFDSLFAQKVLLNGSLPESSTEKTVVDNFDNNSNNWDLFTSKLSSAFIKDGLLNLTSFANEGTARFISSPFETPAYSIEAEFLSAKKDAAMYGLVYNFHNWENYSFFAIRGNYFIVGSVHENIKNIEADWLTCVSVSYDRSNTLKILSNLEETTFAINGDVVFRTEGKVLEKNVGIAIGGKGSKKVDRFILKNFDYQSTYANKTKNASSFNFRKHGTCFLIDKKGYVVTNHHVVDNGKEFVVEFPYNGKAYIAKLVRKDKDNDLAVLKIEDESFAEPDSILYNFKLGGIDVGAEVFALGFPLAYSGLGTEIKFTDGKISSKTGVNNSINMFQTTVPVQSGNSGSPLFNSKGSLVACVNATYTNTDNVSYAIKLNYLNVLLETIDENVTMPESNFIENLSLEEKIKVLSKYIAIIKVK